MDKIINDEDGEIRPRWSLKVKLKAADFFLFLFLCSFPTPSVPPLSQGHSQKSHRPKQETTMLVACSCEDDLVMCLENYYSIT